MKSVQSGDWCNLCSYLITYLTDTLYTWNQGTTQKGTFNDQDDDDLD